MNQVSRLIVALMGGLVFIAFVLLILLLDATGRASSNASAAATQAALAADAQMAQQSLSTERAAQAATWEAEATAALETVDAQQQAMLDAANQRRREAEEAARTTQAALQAQLESAVSAVTAAAATATEAVKLIATNWAAQDATRQAQQTVAVGEAFVEGMRVARGTAVPIFTQSAAGLATAQAQATQQFAFMNAVIGPSATAAANNLMTQQAKVSALQTELASNFIPLFPTIVLIYETPTPGGAVGEAAIPSPVLMPTPVAVMSSPTMPGPTLTPSPTAIMPTVAGQGTPTPVSASTLYRHPSGYFEIVPPSGWEFSESTEENLYSAYWLNQDEPAVVHAFVMRFDAPITFEAAIAHIRDEYASGLANYEAYEVIEEKLGDPVIVDFALSYGGANLRAREWVTLAGNLLGFLRIVVPEARANQLDELGIPILSTYRFYPDAAGVTPGETTATPVAGSAGVVISNLGGIGDLETEYVEIQNTDGTVNLEGWTLCGESDAECYTFPRFVLFPRGTVAVYTRAGQDTPVALYWGRTEPAWSAGERLTLRDAQGNLQSERVAALGYNG